MTPIHRESAPARTLTGRRRPRAARPACESLEGRALMAAYTAYDPTFGQRGVVLGTADPGTGSELSVGTAVAVGADGKIVEVGTFADRPYGQLAVRRFNPDGSADTAFGTGGQAVIPLPAGAFGVQAGPRNVVVQADGSIILAATAALSDPSVSGPRATEGFVAKLTSAGQLDATFASGGRYVFTGTTTTAAAVALDGTNVVVLGAVNEPTDANPSPTQHQLVVTRLTAAGVPDTSFNATGTLDIAFPAAQVDATALIPYYRFDAAALIVEPNGLIYVAGNNVVNRSGSFSTYYANLSRVNPDGTLDTTFGSGGTTVAGAYIAATSFIDSAAIEDMAIDADGKIVVVGETRNPFTSRSFINRLLPDGTLDASFTGNTSTVPPLNKILNLPFTSVAIGTDGAITVGGADPLSGLAGVARYTATGAIDAGFGIRGLAYVNPNVPVAAGQPAIGTNGSIRDLALTADGNVVVAGALSETNRSSSSKTYNLLAQLRPVAVTRLIGDYDGDGVSDVAVYLTQYAGFAIVPSGGSAAFFVQFGVPGQGATIPAPGDYDGDGKTDLAVYIPAQGRLIYRPSAGGPDGVVAIGDSSSIPAPGDYDGDGLTDAAVYNPATGSFVIRDSSTGLSRSFQFGSAGTGASIPVPGDYDGDGKTDIAVYLTQYAGFAVVPSGGSPASFVQFGLPGQGVTIPAPGDYDGDGKTDLAVFIPQSTVYAYRPSGAAAGTPDVLEGIGLPGPGATIPAPGDYDGDGRTDLAVYVPQYALYAYRPSGATTTVPDVWTNFGVVGDGQTVPVPSIPAAQPSVVSASSLASASPGGAGVPLALTGDDLDSLVGILAKKKGKNA